MEVLAAVEFILFVTVAEKLVVLLHGDFCIHLRTQNCRGDKRVVIIKKGCKDHEN